MERHKRGNSWSVTVLPSNLPSMYFMMLYDTNQLLRTPAVFSVYETWPELSTSLFSLMPYFCLKCLFFSCSTQISSIFPDPARISLFHKAFSNHIHEKQPSSCPLTTFLMPSAEYFLKLFGVLAPWGQGEMLPTHSVLPLRDGTVLGTQLVPPICRLDRLNPVARCEC